MYWIHCAYKNYLIAIEGFVLKFYFCVYYILSIAIISASCVIFLSFNDNVPD